MTPSAEERLEDGGPAFGHGDPTHGGDPGMSLRDWFAGLALQSIITSAPMPDEKMAAIVLPAWAVGSYQIADAMLKARAHRSK